MSKPDEKIRKGDLVDWNGKQCRVLKRRRVTGMAMFATCDWELDLSTLDGQHLSWVPENEVSQIESEACE